MNPDSESDSSVDSIPYNPEDDEFGPFNYQDFDSSVESIPYDPEVDITLPYNPEDDEFGPFSCQDPYRTPVISKAVMKGDLEGIKLLLESDEGVNSPDNNGNMPLHLAIINNASMEILNLLLTHPDIDLESKNCIGYTPLLYGLLHKNETNPDIIMHLIEAGCSVNAKNNSDESTMHLAVTYCNKAHKVFITDVIFVLHFVKLYKHLTEKDDSFL